MIMLPGASCPYVIDQRLDNRIIEEIPDGTLEAGQIHPVHKLNRQQRVPPKLEEAVANADVLDA
jgi:hypothetical protein